MGQPIERKENLTPAEKILLLQQIAMYKSVAEIKEWAIEKLGREVPQKTIYYHKEAESNQSMLKKFREEFNQNIISIEWSSKRRRLEELGKVYQECRADGNHSQALKALAQMQEEVEGKKSQALTLNQYNYSTMSDEEIDRKRLELIESIKRHKIINISSTEQEMPQNG
jgi:hypothetical protein